MSNLKIPTEIQVAELINDAVGPLKSIARGLAFERDKLRADLDWTVAALGLMTTERDQLRVDMTKIKKLVENILVSHVEGREFMTSSQLHEAVIQDCTAALNVRR